jgi:hypothetical protein
MLAAIIWHEMTHLDGADERGAQGTEEGLWKRFVVERRVDPVTAPRYLKAMDDRHQVREAVTAEPSDKQLGSQPR